MIVIITANSYFASGITSIAALSAASAYSGATAVAVFPDLGATAEDYLHSAKTIVIDYSYPNIQHLASLLAQKNKYITGDIIFIVKEDLLLAPIENIVINALSSLVLEYASATQRLRAYFRHTYPHTVSHTFKQTIRSVDRNIHLKLSRQEDTLLPYIICGLNNKRIAQATDISNMTISHYRRNIYQKLKVRNITGLYNYLHSL